MQSFDKRVEAVKILRITEADREHTLEMAEHVWQKVKGYPIPDCYSEIGRAHVELQSH